MSLEQLSTPEMFPPPPVASRARYCVLALLCSLAFILYLDRVCISQAEKSIRGELGLSRSQMSLVFMAFTVAYGLFEVPTGHWGDRYGSRGVLTRIVLWWSAFTALTGAGTGLVMLIAIRFLFGAGEAGAYPNTARVLARWLPDSERGIAQGAVLTSALVGGAAAPYLAAILIQEIGWRWTFVVFGGTGVVWAAAFYYWFRDEPSEHPAVGAAELAHITEGTTDRAATGHHSAVPWRVVLTSRNIWLMGFIQSSGAFASYLFLSWYATYLKEARGVSQLGAGKLASLALAGGAVGSLGGGAIANWIVGYSSNPGLWQRLYGFTVMFIAAAMMAVSISVDSVVGATLCCAFGCMCFLSQQPTWWAVVTQISGRHLGALFGLMNSMGVPGAMLSQAIPPVLADWRAEQGYGQREQWDVAFYIYAVILGMGAVCWLFLEPNKPVVGPDDTLDDPGADHAGHNGPTPDGSPEIPAGP